MVVKSINLITETEKQLSKFIYKSKSTQNYKCRNHNSFGAKPTDNGWWRSWPTSPCLQDFSNSGVYLTLPHPWDGIWWPGALADSARQFKLLFVHLNAHPDMSAECSENALLCWKGAKRGVRKNGTWTEKGQRELTEITCPSTSTSWEQNYCAPACGAKSIQLPNEN